MSLPTKPRTLPAIYDPRAIESAIQDGLTAQNNGYKYLQFQINGLPLDKTIAGMVMLASAANELVTGYGAGLYRRSNANTEWRKIIEHTNPRILDPMFDGNWFYSQLDPPDVNTASATLTGANLLRKTITYSSTGGNLTTETGTQIEAAIVAGVGLSTSTIPINFAWDFSIINTGSGVATVVMGASVTAVGRMTVAAGTEGLFQCRKTATNTYTIYRRG